MKQNETPDPAQLGLLRADTVVLQADQVSHLIQQFRISLRGCFVHAHISMRRLGRKSISPVISAGWQEKRTGAGIMIRTADARAAMAARRCVFRRVICVLGCDKPMMYSVKDAPPKGVCAL